MKYISKTHLIVLAVLIFFVGLILLAGEHVSQEGFTSRTTESPVEALSGNEKQLPYSSAEQQQLMQSDSFVIRSGESRLTYVEALNLYGSHILQFDESCQVSSKSRSFPLGNEIMIDNRSSKPNTFSVGDVSVVLGPYDFGFMILHQKGNQVPVDCGSRRNVAALSVQ